MAIFFAANALWWGYRAGATIARGYLDWQAGQHGTTLEAGFENARLKRQFGQISWAEARLVDWVAFNDRWAWSSLKDFAIDTSAMATAGLGLVAKVSLGKRIATVFGVKHAAAGGEIIDGVIDIMGAVVTQGLNPANAIKGLFDLVGKSQESLTPLLKAGSEVAVAAADLASIISPLLGGGVKPIAVLTALPAAVSAGVNLFSSILGFWSAVGPLIPETTLPPASPTRNLLREIRDHGPKATGPSEFWLTPAAPPPPPRARPPGVSPPNPDSWDPTRDLRRLGGAGDLPLPPIFAPPPARKEFVRRFSNGGIVGGSLRALKGRKTAGTFPFG